MLQRAISADWPSVRVLVALCRHASQVGCLTFVAIPLHRGVPLPFELKTIRARNRLHLKAWGHPTAEGAFACASAAMTELSRLRAGYDVISDVSGLSSLSNRCMPQVDRLTSFLVASQVGRVVRVCGPLPEIIVKLERKARASGYSAHLATSVAEAEALLDDTR
jgi:hypothetical protein